MDIQQLYSKFQLTSGICTDTRNIGKNSMFFALKGANFNGNEFAEKALESGSLFAVVDEKKFVTKENIILVDNVLECLQDLAAHHRKQFQFPVIGLTGSNGKTTTKELIAAVLQQKFKTHYTQGNLNNHIGVPLTILSTPLSAEVLIVEMGANHQGEIALLSRICNPDFGLISNIGKAHLEGFGGVEGVKKGKTELYRQLNSSGAKAFFNLNEGSILEFKSQVLHPLFYGGDSNVQVISVDNSGEFIKVRLNINKNEVLISTQLFGEYNVNNVLTAAAIGAYFNLSPHEIKKGIESYEPSNNRSQVKVTEKNNTLILDAYNANPTSLSNAVKQFGKTSDDSSYFILGDMLELGEHAHSEHKAILDLLLNYKGKKILVGKEFSEFNSTYPFVFFVSSLEVGNYIQNNPVSSAKILIKGSRGIALEKVVPFL